jgi:uncharacterized NAD(P)/FAD-binding protein YdhS
MLFMKQINIIGAGFAGSAVAMQLIQQARTALQIRLFERTDQAQTGVAYADQGLDLLLNVPAGRMSLWPDLPHHFVHWLAQQVEFSALTVPQLASSFVPRRCYGRYLQQQWQHSQQLAKSKGILLESINADIRQLQIRQGKPLIYGHRLDAAPQQGEPWHFDHWHSDALILACGNEQPAAPAVMPTELRQHPAYRPDPWRAQSYQGLTADSQVLILGNGLSMVDAVLALRQAGVHRPVLSLSPHGFAMLAHPTVTTTASQSQQPPLPPTAASSPRALFNWFQQHRQPHTDAAKLDAQQLLDAIRPHSQRYWRQFSDWQKQQFLRHLRHRWGVLRHKLPPEMMATIFDAQQQGWLQVRAGQLQAVAPCGEQLLVEWRGRGESTRQQLRVDALINCTGPATDYRRLPGHWLQQAIADGILAPGPLGQGLALAVTTAGHDDKALVTAELQLADAQGQAQAGLYAMGPMLRGALWETTAVHEIRQQAVLIATAVLSR